MNSDKFKVQYLLLYAIAVPEKDGWEPNSVNNCRIAFPGVVG